MWSGVSSRCMKNGQARNYGISEQKRSLVGFESVLNCKNIFFPRNVCLRGISGLRCQNAKVLLKSADLKGLTCSPENLGRWVVLKQAIY